MGQARSVAFDTTDLGVMLHVIGVSVWFGGQLVMAAVVPALRRYDRESLPVAAQAFAKLAWPAYVVAIASGFWLMFAALAEDPQPTAGWSGLLGIKMMFVAISGGGAWVHQRTESRTLKAVGAAIALASALVALIMGATLQG